MTIERFIWPMTKILIIEDNESLNQVYKFILEREGYSVKTVFNGKEGIKAVKTDLPDLILLDMLMPEMNGIAFLKKFNSVRKLKSRIIILSNLDEDSEMNEARKLGVSEYILKASASPLELAEKVKKVLKQPID
jgi:two-component system alkaline phosphatase synthesis response regulator PhoP